MLEIFYIEIVNNYIKILEVYMVYKLFLIYILIEKCFDWSKIIILLICINKKNKWKNFMEYILFCFKICIIEM